MELPLGNFFEVTVNTNKLAGFMDDVIRKVQTQSDRIDELNKIVTAFTSSVGGRLKKSEETVQIELEKVKRAAQEESNYLRLFLKDSDKKVEQKINDFQNSLVLFNARINHARDSIQDDIAIKISYLDKKLQNALSSDELEKQLAAQKLDTAGICEDIQRRLGERVKAVEETSEGKRAMDDSAIEGATSHRCLGSRNPCLSRSRKRLKSHRNATLYENQDEIDSIVNKISQLENRLMQDKQQKQGNIISNNRVVKINENVTNVSNNNPNQRKNRPQTDIQSKVSSKLAKIEEILVTKLGECERNILKLTNRHEIVDEQMGILTRRHEKEKARVNEVVNSFKKIEERKIDEKVIEGLKNNLKKLSKDVEQGLEARLNKEIFEKERAKIYQRVHVISQAVLDKAEKGEVKKGFSFFQQKLKEIIIVLAEQKSYNKDSAAKRTPFKCLSCDKQLEITENQPPLIRNPRDSTNGTARCSTSQLRKRIRVVNNSIPDS